MKILVKLQTFAFLLLTSCGGFKAYPGPELPAEKTATVVFRSTSFEYDVSYNDKRIDSYFVGDSINFAAVQPGPHSIEFSWSFETADDGNDSGGLFASWEKHGRCKLTFQAEAGAEYTISADAANSGTWVSDPVVEASVKRKCGKFLCQDEEVAESSCTYDGRRPSVFFDVNLSS